MTPSSLIPKPFSGLFLAAILAAATLPAGAQITVANSNSLRSLTGGVTSYTVSFDAGATADKLIVSACYEGGPAASALTITYNGDALTMVPGTSGTRNKGIWYLDNPFTGDAADVVISAGGAAFAGMGMGIVSIAGSADGYGNGANANAPSVTLNVPVADSFVFANCAANDGAIPTPAAPLTELYRGALNSSEGAAGYAENIASGSQSFSFSGTLTSPETSAAVFVPTDVVPVIVATSPADDEIHIQPSANLVATFNESVTAGTGTITIKSTSDNSTVESFDVATSSRLSFSGTGITIDPTGNLQNGVEYHVLIDPGAIVDSTANPFAGISDPATWNFTTRPGLDTVEGRMVSMLQKNIDDPWPLNVDANGNVLDPNNSSGVFPYALACLYLNQNVGQANDLIVDYYTNNPNTDTASPSYFWQHIMWRLYHDPTSNSRLTTQTRDLIEDNMWSWLRTRSTLAEAGQTEWKIHDSENHDAMQKGGHLVCLIALKNASRYGPDMVLADGGTIAEHIAAWTDFFMRYFKARAMEGINVEIACPQYARYTVGAYYNIMDFADSPVLRTMAKQFIDLYWADTVSDWVSSGVRGGAQTRVYRESSYLKLGTTYAFRGVLWGYKWREGTGGVSTYGLIPATSPYRVPDIITAIATDPARPNFLYSSRRFGRGGAWDSNKDYSVVFDSGNSNLRRDTWVTPDYSMGTLTVDMNKDYIALIDQNRVMGIMFASGPDHRIMVFGEGGTADTTTSFTDTTGVTREDCMIVQRDKNASSSGNAQQIFVAQAAWNNRVETGGWFFTQLGNAYCAVRPAGGGYTSASTAYGYYLTLGDMWAPVIIQTGQAGNYASFTDFQNSVIANSLTYVSGTMNYTSEAGDTFTFYANTKTTPRVNGATVNLNPAKTYDSPYLSMVHGEDVATVSYTGFPDLLLDFGDPPVLLATDPVDDATGVAVFQNLVATFDGTVMAGTGSIVLRRSSDNSVVESFDVATSPRLIFSGSTLTVDPTANLDISTSYYVTIDPTAVKYPSGAAFAGLAGNSAWNFTTSDSDTSSIIALNNGFFGGSAPGVTVTQSIDVGVGADMLIVMTSSELGLAGMTVTYGGVPMDLAVGNKTTSAIWYLDLSTPGISGTDVVVDLSNSGSRNGFSAGWVSVDANLGPDQSIVVHSTGTSASQSNTVDLTTTVETFNVVNFNANNTSKGITVDSPNPTVIYTDNNIGSAEGAAAYAFAVAAGSNTYQWTLAGLTPPNADYRRIDAAAFAIVGNNFSDWITGYPGVGGQTGLNDDPDGDGDPNGVEAWFGTNPAVSSGGLANLSTAGTITTFTHPVSANPPDDLSLVYQWSPNLIDWYAGDGVDGPLTSQTVIISSSTVDTTTTVTATASEPMNGLFLRAAVIRNPSP